MFYFPGLSELFERMEQFDSLRLLLRRIRYNIVCSKVSLGNYEIARFTMLPKLDAYMKYALSMDEKQFQNMSLVDLRDDFYDTLTPLEYFAYQRLIQDWKDI